MPRMPRLLVDAARLIVAEDRLTDMVAVCANHSLAFANRLLALGELRPGVASEARTQVWTRSGGRVDLELVALGDDGREVARAWFENKVGAAYQDAQLEDYAEDLSAVTRVGRLITVVPELTDAPLDPADRWSRATWRDIARAAWDAGRCITQDSRWRVSARHPRGPLELALLDELLTYLDKEYKAVADPIGPEEILAFAGYADAYEALDALLTRASLLTGLGDAGGGWGDDGGSAWRNFAASDSWVAPIGGWTELHLADRDYWATERREHPALGAGLTLPWEMLDQVRDEARTDWRRQVFAAGYSLHPDDREQLVRIYRTKYLVEVMTAGVTLDEQARHVAEWTARAIADLNALMPQPALVVPERKRGGRRAADVPVPTFDAPDRVSPSSE
jgi:hypothetical protein